MPMNKTLRKLTAIAVLGSVLAPASAMASTAEAGIESTGSRFSILSEPATKKSGTLVTDPDRLPFNGRTWSYGEPALLPAGALSKGISSFMLAQQETQAPEADLKQLGRQESEYGRRKAAALAKKGTGTVIGSTAVIAALGLAVLGWNKHEEEEKAKVPDNERESAYYFIGAIAVGAGVGSWGFSLRRRGQAELNNLEARQISFGTDRHGNPVLLYSARF